jgi:hypothetical protein
MKPKVSQVTKWVEVEFISNSVAKVFVADNYDDFWKVVGGERQSISTARQHGRMLKDALQIFTAKSSLHN